MYHYGVSFDLLRPRTLVLVAAMMLCATAAVADPPDSAMYHNDHRRTGRSGFVGTADPSLSWLYTTGSYITSAPAIGADGTLYVGSYDNKLHAVSQMGYKRWTYSTFGQIGSSPAITDHGVIYFGSADCNLYAVNPDGTQKWSVSYAWPAGYPVSPIYSAPLIGVDGDIVYSTNAGNVFSVNGATGALNWSHRMPKATQSSPAMDDDGNVYIGCSDSSLYSLSPSGSLRWAFPTGGQIVSVPSISSDGTIYVTSSDGRLYAINPDGTSKWTHFSSWSGATSSPAIGSDGSVYFCTYEGRVLCVSADGVRKWEYRTLGSISASPQLDADDNLYIGNHNGDFFSISSDGTLRWQTDLRSRVYGPAVIGSAGQIYVGLEGNAIAAFGASPEVPEPATIVQLMAAGAALGFGAMRRGRRR